MVYIGIATYDGKLHWATAAGLVPTILDTWLVPPSRSIKLESEIFSFISHLNLYVVILQ